jgi:hypothetical protein
MDNGDPAFGIPDGMAIRNHLSPSIVPSAWNLDPLALRIELREGKIIVVMGFLKNSEHSQESHELGAELCLRGILSLLSGAPSLEISAV